MFMKNVKTQVEFIMNVDNANDLVLPVDKALLDKVTCVVNPIIKSYSFDDPEGEITLCTLPNPLG